MSKLSKIFAELHEDKDLIKQKYYAEKIVETLMVQDLMEGKVFDAYNMEEIEKKIFSEAIKKKSVNESLKFVEGIEKQIDEGFFSALKNLGSAAIAGVKKVAGKIKNAISSWWNGKFPGKIDVAIDKWHTTVKTAKATLEKNNSSGVVESVILGLDTSYMLDSDVEMISLMEGLADSQATLDQEENEGKPQNPEVSAEKDGKPADLAASMQAVVSSLVAKNSLVYKTGFGIAGYKMYKVEKVKQTKILSFGNDENTLVPVVKVIIGYPFTLTVPTQINGAGINVIRLLVKTIKKNPAFKFDEKLDDKSFGKLVDRKIMKSGGVSYVISKTGKISAQQGAATPTDAAATPTDAAATPTDAAATPTDAAATPATPTDAAATPATPTDAAATPTEEKSDDNKLIDDIITAAKSKGAPAEFYKRLGTSPEAVWGAFEQFAGNGVNDHNPVKILANSGKTPPSEMGPAEYTVYLASVPTIVSSLIRQANSGKVPEQYKKRADKYVDFLEEIDPAAVDLSKEMLTITGLSGNAAAAPAGGTPTAKAEPTAKAPKTQADEDAFNAMEL